MRKKIALCLAVIVVILLASWVRVSVDGRQARRQADRLLASGNPDEAVGFYDRTLHMYWPGSPDVARAVEALSALAGEREAGGDAEGALYAWRVLRSGLYAARGLYQPYSETIALSETHIAGLMARREGDDESREKYLALLRENRDPNRFWSMLALLGFAVWVIGVLGVIWKGLTPEGKWIGRAALLWSGVFLIGFTVWILGLYLA